eukprot:1149267-Pelagomonas_calceolata.AAC.7
MNSRVLESCLGAECLLLLKQVQLAPRLKWAGLRGQQGPGRACCCCCYSPLPFDFPGSLVAGLQGLRHVPPRAHAFASCKSVVSPSLLLEWACSTAAGEQSWVAAVSRIAY